MEQTVLVRRLIQDGMAEVSLVRESACSGDCHKCAGCGAAQETLIFQAHNPIGAQVGDVVKVQSKSSPVLKAAAVLYLLPLVLFVAGYLLGEHLWGRGVLVSLIGFVLGAVPIRPLDRHLKKTMQYTITEFAGKKPAENER